jgi:hypothetical protein
MPDTLKQFYNATINVTGLTGNQTATLFTNNATTRAVIKDIDVANTFLTTPNLVVGGTPTAALSANLTGSEIVDVSQAVQVSFPAPLVYTSTTTAVLNAGPTQITTNRFDIDGTQVSTAAITQTSPAAETTLFSAAFATVVYYASDGDVFSVQTDGSANWGLFKNAGSAGGTRTTINTGNTNTFSCIAFDGINTFYWLSSTTNLRAFNADTETTTNTTVAAVPAATTMSRLLYSNGYLMYGNTNLASLYIIEISTGRWALLNADTWPYDQTNSMPGFWFEPSTRVARMLSYYSAAGTYYRNILPALPTLTAASVTISTSWSTTTLSASSFVGGTPANNAVNVVLASADGGVIHSNSHLPFVLSGISGAASGWTLSTQLSSFNSSFWRARRFTNFSPTLNTTNFPNTITLRVTGVEVTP